MKFSHVTYDNEERQIWNYNIDALVQLAYVRTQSTHHSWLMEMEQFSLSNITGSTSTSATNGQLLDWMMGYHNL